MFSCVSLLCPQWLCAQTGRAGSAPSYRYGKQHNIIWNTVTVPDEIENHETSLWCLSILFCKHNIKYCIHLQKHKISLFLWCKKLSYIREYMEAVVTLTKVYLLNLRDCKQWLPHLWLGSTSLVSLDPNKDESPPIQWDKHCSFNNTIKATK